MVEAPVADLSGVWDIKNRVGIYMVKIKNICLGSLHNWGGVGGIHPFRAVLKEGMVVAETASVGSEFQMRMASGKKEYLKVLEFGWAAILLSLCPLSVMLCSFSLSRVGGSWMSMRLFMTLYVMQALSITLLDSRDSNPSRF